jgi:hypothetical protein
VRVVSNAGGLNPRGLRDRLLAIAQQLGVTPHIAVVEGDDLVDRVDDLRARGVAIPADAVTANAYLGGWGIARALDAGADIVVCGRVSDAALVVGPAAWWHDWRPDDWDALAGAVVGGHVIECGPQATGAVVAGHVIECGPQATGGNYPFLAELAPGAPGFPIAEVAADGSTVITKQPGTGGAVTIGTVTAQLLYEIGTPEYANPDVVARFDTVRLADDGPDRVRISATRGTPAPPSLKVATNRRGGYRNSMTMVLTGLDIEAKAAHAERLLFDALGGREQFDTVAVQLIRSDHADADTNEGAMAQLRVIVQDRDATKVGRRFANAVTELALASYAGFFTTSPPTAETEFGVYEPVYLDASLVEHAVLLPDGARVVIEPTALEPADARVEAEPVRPAAATSATGPTARRPLGAVCGARSGDKGGDANVGLWTRTDEAYAWLESYLTVDRLRALVPEAASLAIDRYELANLRALNFVVHGLLGAGVASSVRVDAQAKGLGEYVRSRLVDIPTAIL